MTEGLQPLNSQRYINERECGRKRGAVVTFLRRHYPDQVLRVWSQPWFALRPGHPGNFSKAKL